MIKFVMCSVLELSFLNCNNLLFKYRLTGKDLFPGVGFNLVLKLNK